MTTTPQAALLSAQNPLLKRCYTMSESHLSGYRVVIGFERLEDAQDAHEYIAKLQATQEPSRVFPPRIMELLEQVADRNPGAAKGPWEDAQGLPMQDDADAAISWIKARSVATQEPVQAGELPDEREAFEAHMVDDGYEEVPRICKDGSPSAGEYADSFWQGKWETWQARAALSARKPLTDEQRTMFKNVTYMLDAYVECIKSSGEYEAWHYIPEIEATRDDLNSYVSDAHGIGLEVKP